MFCEDPSSGEPPLCKGCERPIIGRSYDGYHERCERVFKSLNRALDMLQGRFG